MAEPDKPSIFLVDIGEARCVFAGLHMTEWVGLGAFFIDGNQQLSLMSRFVCHQDSGVSHAAHHNYERGDSADLAKERLTPEKPDTLASGFQERPETLFFDAGFSRRCGSAFYRRDAWRCWWPCGGSLCGWMSGDLHGREPPFLVV
jgi:hypothetical protein